MKKNKKLLIGIGAFFALYGATVMATGLMFNHQDSLERELREYQEDVNFLTTQKTSIEKRLKHKQELFNSTRCLLAALKREEGQDVTKDTEELCF